MHPFWQTRGPLAAAAQRARIAVVMALEIGVGRPEERHQIPRLLCSARLLLRSLRRCRLEGGVRRSGVSLTLRQASFVGNERFGAVDQSLQAGVLCLQAGRVLA